MTLGVLATRNHADNISSLTFALTGAAFSRILSELAASGLLAAGPFAHQRDADAALTALVISNHALLELQVADFFPVDPFDTPAVAAVPAIPGGRGGRGRGRGAVAAVPGQAAIAAVPGPLNLAFLDICSMLAFADAHGGPHPLTTFCLLVGALGPLASHASRLASRSSVHVPSPTPSAHPRRCRLASMPPRLRRRPAIPSSSPPSPRPSNRRTVR